jgi:phage terminase large subunit-like protein
MPATARHLAELPPDQRRAALAGLSAEDLQRLEYEWRFWARPDQLPPEGDWRTFLLLGGRGAGKTKSASEWIRAEMESGRRRNMGIIGPTADAVRRIMIEGPSGLLSVCPPWCRPSYEPSTRRIVWPNGGVVYAFSAEEPDRLRGPNFDGHWCDEITSWANAADVWDMLQMALRIPGPQGHPRRRVSSAQRRRTSRCSSRSWRHQARSSAAPGPPTTPATWMPVLSPTCKTSTEILD